MTLDKWISTSTDKWINTSTDKWEPTIYSLGSFSNELENKLLDHIFNGTYSAPDTYIGLSTAAILDDASGNAEPAGGSYARKQILPAAWNNAASRAIQNNGAITFPQATASWGTLTHWGIWNHVSDEAEVNLLVHGELPAPQIINSGNVFSVIDEGLTISFNPSGASDYLANTFLDYVFKDEAFATPNATIHVALLTANPTDAGTGSTITEPGDTYNRILHTDWTYGGTTDHIENASSIDFDNPAGSWGEITHTCQVDAVSNGNMLFYGRVGVAQTPDLGSTVSFAASAYDITVT